MMLAPNGAIFTDQNYPSAAPHNIEAEQALLGALLIGNDVFDKVVDAVAAADFYDPLHAEIYEVIAKRLTSGRQVDVISLRTLFQNALPITDTLTVPIYIGRLAASATTTINAPEYARTVRDLALRREIIRIGSDAVTAATDACVDASPAALIEEIEGALFGLAERGERGGEVSFDVALRAALEDASEAYRVGGGIRGLSTGLIDLDKRLGGLAPGGLYIIAGRPGMGKTALATNIAWSVTGDGLAVGFFSLEMPFSELAMRIMAQESGISSEGLRRGAAGEDGVRKAVFAAQRIGNRPLYIDDRGGVSIAQIAARARRQRRRHGIELIVIDYLQLMASGKRKENRVQEITEITTGLKALAKELNVPIIALSQLSRGVESRENKRPHLADLRESGSIEQDADAVIFVYREEYYLDLARPPESDLDKLMAWEAAMRKAHGKAEVIVAKNRHGGVGAAELYFDASVTQFKNLAREVSP